MTTELVPRQGPFGVGTRSHHAPSMLGGYFLAPAPAVGLRPGLLPRSLEPPCCRLPQCGSCLQRLLNADSWLIPKPSESEYLGWGPRTLPLKVSQVILMHGLGCVFNRPTSLGFQQSQRGLNLRISLNSTTGHFCHKSVSPEYGENISRESNRHHSLACVLGAFEAGQQHVTRRRGLGSWE